MVVGTHGCAGNDEMLDEFSKMGEIDVECECRP